MDMDMDYFREVFDVTFWSFVEEKICTSMIIFPWTMLTPLLIYVLFCDVFYIIYLWQVLVSDLFFAL